MNNRSSYELIDLNRRIAEHKTTYKLLTAARLLTNLFDVFFCSLTAGFTIKAIKSEYFLPEPEANNSYNYYNLNMCVIVGNFIYTFFALWPALVNIYAWYSGNFVANHSSMDYLAQRNSTMANSGYGSNKDFHNKWLLFKCAVLLFMMLFTFSVNIALYVCNQHYDLVHAWAETSAIMALVTAIIIPLASAAAFFICLKLDTMIDELLDVYDEYPTIGTGIYAHRIDYNLYEKLMDNSNESSKLINKCHWCKGSGRKRCNICRGTGLQPCACGLIKEQVGVGYLKRDCIDRDTLGYPVYGEPHVVQSSQLQLKQSHCDQCDAVPGMSKSCPHCDKGYRDCDMCDIQEV